jgi:hypothetical protein
MVDLCKLDPATMAQHLGKPEGEIGRALADSMAERNWPVYEAAFKRLGVRSGERVFEVGFGVVVRSKGYGGRRANIGCSEDQGCSL